MLLPNELSARDCVIVTIRPVLQCVARAIYCSTSRHRAYHSHHIPGSDGVVPRALDIHATVQIPAKILYYRVRCLRCDVQTGDTYDFTLIAVDRVPAKNASASQEPCKYLGTGTEYFLSTWNSKRSRGITQGTESSSPGESWGICTDQSAVLQVHGAACVFEGATLTH